MLVQCWFFAVARFEGACKTMCATQSDSAMLCFAVARFETAEETVVASRSVSAVLSFRTHPFCLPLAELEGKMPLAADEV